MVDDQPSETLASTQPEFPRLADALHSTAAAVLLLGADGRVDYANRAAAQLLGRPSEGLAGRHLTDVLRLETDPETEALWQEAFDAPGEWAGEAGAVRPGGQRVTCMATLSPIRRAAGSTDGFVVTLRDVSERVAMEEALRSANRRLADQASHDHLTGLYNRAFLREVLDRECARSARSGFPLTALMADLDRFKRVNDTSGHEQGDVVLQRVAKALPQAVRDGDIVSRWGGDEFCVLLPQTEAVAGYAVAERLRDIVREPEYGLEVEYAITVSVGLATSPDPETGTNARPEDLLRNADHALLRAKRRGGDQVVVWEPGS